MGHVTVCTVEEVWHEGGRAIVGVYSSLAAAEGALRDSGAEPTNRIGEWSKPCKRGWPRVFSVSAWEVDADAPQ